MKIKEVKKILLILIVGILLVGSILAFSLSDYITISTLTELSSKKLCDVELIWNKLNKYCTGEEKVIKISKDSKLKIDVLEESKTKREVLKVYQK